MRGSQQWRPPPGTAVRVTIPDGSKRTLDTTTCSVVFGAQLVAVNGLQQCIPLDWCEPLPADAPPLEYQTHRGPFGQSTSVVPRWGAAP